MPTDDQIEVYKQHRASQEKYVYFLLAAVGAAVALAVNQTQGVKLSSSQLLLGVAITLWGIIFIFGCKHLGHVQTTLMANSELLRVEAGEHPKVGSRGELAAVALEALREIIELNSRRANRYQRWQFLAFVLGAIFYLAWHVFEMWHRTFLA